jgi:gamma-glutamyltranspeptidase/glutathione hydrolase
MTLEVATLSPRLHFDGETLQVEPGFADNEMDALRAIAPINAWGSRSLYFGGAHSVTPDGGFGDPRRSGCAVSF